MAPAPVACQTPPPGLLGTDTQGALDNAIDSNSDDSDSNDSDSNDSDSNESDSDDSGETDEASCAESGGIDSLRILNRGVAQHAQLHHPLSQYSLDAAP